MVGSISIGLRRHSAVFVNQFLPIQDNDGNAVRTSAVRNKVKCNGFREQCAAIVSIGVVRNGQQLFGRQALQHRSGV